MTKVNDWYAAIDDRLKYKWKEIKNLDTTEKDLNKLKNLGDLPEAFKESLAKYEISWKLEDVEKPIKMYLSFKDVLHQYKNTNFLVNVSSEIYSYVTRVKIELRKDIDNNTDRDQGEFYKIVQYLQKLGQDGEDL